MQFVLACNEVVGGGCKVVESYKTCLLQLCVQFQFLVCDLVVNFTWAVCIHMYVPHMYMHVHTYYGIQMIYMLQYVCGVRMM